MRDNLLNASFNQIHNEANIHLKKKIRVSSDYTQTKEKDFYHNYNQSQIPFNSSNKKETKKSKFFNKFLNENLLKVQEEFNNMDLNNQIFKAQELDLEENNENINKEKIRRNKRKESEGSNSIIINENVNIEANRILNLEDLLRNKIKREKKRFEKCIKKIPFEEEKENEEKIQNDKEENYQYKNSPKKIRLEKIPEKAKNLIIPLLNTNNNNINMSIDNYNNNYNSFYNNNYEAMEMEEITDLKDFKDLKDNFFINKNNNSNNYNDNDNDNSDQETLNTLNTEDLCSSFMTEYSTKHVQGSLIKNAINTERLMMRLFDISNPSLQPHEK